MVEQLRGLMVQDVLENIEAEGRGLLARPP